MTVTDYSVQERFEIAKTIREQIGFGNLLAISGGRRAISDLFLGIVLPVGHGYRVEVEYHPGRDTYSVRRVFTRGTKRWVKGEIDYVYSDEVGEIAYRASCYENVSFGEHKP